MLVKLRALYSLHQIADDFLWDSQAPFSGRWSWIKTMAFNAMGHHPLAHSQKRNLGQSERSTFRLASTAMSFHTASAYSDCEDPSPKSNCYA